MMAKVQNTASSMKDTADKTKMAALIIRLDLGLLSLFVLDGK
jgi:hypothetical protein